MRYIATAKEMQDIDKASIEEFGIPALILMERAAFAVASELQNRFEAGSKILIAVGNGNNGGDGMALARILFEEGYQVLVWEIYPSERTTESLAIQKKILVKMGVPFAEKDFLEKKDCEFDVIVDAVFGVGLSRTIEGTFRDAILKLNSAQAYKVAVDVPSGLFATTGKTAGVCFQADLTITFGLCKRGQVLFPGLTYCGEVIVKNIGFPKQVIDRMPPETYTFDREDLALLPKRMPDSHKGTYGRVAVIAGSRFISGACVLAAKAALRTGCGMVKVYTHTDNRTILGTTVPEALIMTYEDAVSCVSCVEDALNFADVILIGPGLGMDALSFLLMKELFNRCDKPCVVDADGLNILAQNKELFARRSFDMVITPHIKEMSRLTGMSVEDIKKDPVKSCRLFAKDGHVICVMKDSRTIVSDGGSRVYINTSGNNGMATAGSGDVLAGMTASLAAQKKNLMEAAALAVYVHGLAGDFAADKMEKTCMTAGDIVKALPEVYHLGKITDEIQK